VRLLVCRTDRLGDLVLSLPVFSRLKAALPGCEIHALAAPAAAALVESDPSVDRVLIWDPAAAELASAMIAAAGYDAALMLLYRRDVAWSLRRAGVPHLVGPLSKPSSWLLLNGGMRQRRSRADRHERDYNLELAGRLIELLGGEADPPGWNPTPRLHAAQKQIETGRLFRLAEAPGADVVAFIHPGMGGSALNWPPSRFAAVAGELASRPGWRVFLTGGPADRAVTAEVAAQCGAAVVDLTGRFDLRTFIGVLAAGDLIIAPSTGPLHMAAALGLAAVGVYPPLPVQSPRRWGPLGPRAVALAPEVACPESLRCRGEECGHWNCLEMISVESVVAAAEAAVARTDIGTDRKD